MPKKTKQQILEILKNGKVKLATVSGVLTTKPNLVEWVDREIPEINLITSKSYQVKLNPGNREPIFTEIAVGNFGNAVGLKNPGMDSGYEELVKLQRKREMRSLLIVSLSASSIEDFITLVKKFEDIADILELNFSCPHAAAGFGSSIGCDAKVVAEYMKEIRKASSALLFPKLTPNVDNIGEIAKAAIDSGADGIVAINTVGPELFIEPHTGQPLLNNPHGHKGGKSGDWIKEVAREKIKEIREAIGSDVPVIGMGGVSAGEDVAKMMEAGADVVGVGSITARVRQSLLPQFFSVLKSDAEKVFSAINKQQTPPTPLIPPEGGHGRGESSSQFLFKERLAEYKPFKIKKTIEKGNDLKIFELDGQMDYKASQFVFIWVPEVGEKPFAIVKTDPLTFIVRKREYNPDEKKGLVTHAIFQLKEGDEMIVRGVYGADAPDSSKNNAYIVAGGTGIAIVPKLAEKLNQQGKSVIVYCGVASKEQIVFEEEIEKFAKYVPVADDGVVGRVLGILEENLKTLESSLRDSNGAIKVDSNDVCFYNIGPPILMKKAMEIQKKLGTDSKEIFASIETNNMCGMGVCGECECGGVLACQEGTFFSLEFLEEKNINIMEI